MDVVLLSTYQLSIAAGWLERPLAPNMVRLRWHCNCGDSLFSDVVECRPNGIADLIANMERASAIKVRATPYIRHSGNQQYVKPNLGPWLRTTVNAVASIFGRTGTPSSCLPQHTKLHATATRTTPTVDPAQRQALHLMACMHRDQQRKILKQDRVEAIHTDRDLLAFLHRQYIHHRGRILSIFSLRNIKGIHFIKFHLPMGGSVIVRNHDPCCVAVTDTTALRTCECIPPKAKVEPSPTAEYRCTPGPPATHPLIPPEYLLMLMTCPSHTHEQDTWILDQIPRRTCGELRGKVGQPAEGWGIYYQEDWNCDMIVLGVYIIFLLASLLFGILWSVYKFDIQGAFGVSAYMVSMVVILVHLTAMGAEKMR
ncbi:hypothetical protein P153DRAFT_285294 [Dothidotthia symphoricarpi CBS 119687]|uniref:Uncharacterized protein n=1 Tax=Dothidotthia symphoricarpi CBS 119687 TaxID=1392245 RepID=A0A6A6AMG5_9PLEO|nr:uncharacterized protein P153DRAFT_285294 [Dothidotthia symphoricarpi CBS 119687]KAF2132124.1 hypothetical protein P153DRAFT_285294 [Dothidotthia symphoricarpi CBS 119687]